MKVSMVVLVESWGNVRDSRTGYTEFLPHVLSERSTICEVELYVYPSQAKATLRKDTFISTCHLTYMKHHVHRKWLNS